MEEKSVLLGGFLIYQLVVLTIMTFTAVSLIFWPAVNVWTANLVVIAYCWIIAGGVKRSQNKLRKKDAGSTRAVVEIYFIAIALIASLIFWPWGNLWLSNAVAIVFSALLIYAGFVIFLPEYKHLKMVTEEYRKEKDRVLKILEIGAMAAIIQKTRS